MSVVRALRDDALPGLATILDEAALLELLSRHLPEAREGAKLLGARAVDVQYAPRESASVLVRLKFNEADSGRTKRQLLCVRALRVDDAPPECPPGLLDRHAARRATREGARETPLRTAWLPLPEASIVVHAFPLDPGLPTLVDAADPASLKEALTRLWSPTGVRARRVKVDTLAYTPGSRCALAYEILAEERGTRVPLQRRLVGKLHARRAPSRLFAGAWALWRKSHGRVNIAPPVGFVDSIGLSLQEFVQGGRLSDLAGTGGFLKPVRQAARAIAHVHQQHLPLHSERDVAKESVVVRRWLGVLRSVMPERSEDLERLGERLLSELAARFTPRGAVHADFHLANVLVHRDTVTIVDWDQVAHGDPMLDVGRFLASLRVSAFRTRNDASGLDAAADAFLAAYLAASGDDEGRARLFEAGALLIAAAAPFRLQREDWRAQAESMVDEAWRCLELSVRGDRVAVASREALVPFEDRRAWASDPTLMMALISPLLRASRPSLDLVECRPKVLHADREILELGYDLKGFLGTDAWRGRVVARGERAHGGKSLLERMDALSAALPPGALRLPRALGRIGALALVAVESAAGERIDRALEKEGVRVAGALGVALAVLESADIPAVKERPVAKELRAARRRLEALSVAEVGQRGEALLARIADGAAAQPARLVPTLRRLRLQDLAWDGMTPGLCAPRDVALGQVGAGAGALLGRLAEWEIAHATTGLADAFAREWLRASGVAPPALAPFAALGLARSAIRAARAGDIGAAGRLLANAESRLDAASG